LEFFIHKGKLLCFLLCWVTNLSFRTLRSFEMIYLVFSGMIMSSMYPLSAALSGLANWKL